MGIDETSELQKCAVYWGVTPFSDVWLLTAWKPYISPPFVPYIWQADKKAWLLLPSAPERDSNPVSSCPSWELSLQPHPHPHAHRLPSHRNLNFMRNKLFHSYVFMWHHQSHVNQVWGRGLPCFCWVTLTKKISPLFLFSTSEEVKPVTHNPQSSHFADKCDSFLPVWITNPASLPFCHFLKHLELLSVTPGSTSISLWAEWSLPKRKQNPSEKNKIRTQWICFNGY